MKEFNRLFLGLQYDMTARLWDVFVFIGHRCFHSDFNMRERKKKQKKTEERNWIINY